MYDMEGYHEGLSSWAALSRFVLRQNERKVRNDMDGGIPGSQAAGHEANRKIYSKSLLAAAFGLAGGHISYIPQD